MDITMKCVMGVPRAMSSFCLWHTQQVLANCGQQLDINQGIFWGHCMQEDFETAVLDGRTWILCIDGDSLFTETHFRALVNRFAANPKWDALAALQPKRGAKHALAFNGDQYASADEPFQVEMAHHGLTLLRTDALRDIPKPWFRAVPNKDGDWQNGQLNDDAYFWKKWAEHGKTVWVDPTVSIGHMEETVACFTHEGHAYLTIKEWLNNVYAPGTVNRTIGEVRQRSA